jgi:hypothetical protein
MRTTENAATDTIVVVNGNDNLGLIKLLVELNGNPQACVSTREWRFVNVDPTDFAMAHMHIGAGAERVEMNVIVLRNLVEQVLAPRTAELTELFNQLMHALEIELAADEKTRIRDDLYLLRQLSVLIEALPTLLEIARLADDLETYPLYRRLSEKLCPTYLALTEALRNEVFPNC